MTYTADFVKESIAIEADFRKHDEVMDWEKEAIATDVDLETADLADMDLAELFAAADAIADKW